MALIKKRDVPSYFAERKRKAKLPFGSTSQPDATGFSGKEHGSKILKSEYPVRDPLAPTSSSQAEILVSEALPRLNDSIDQGAFRNAHS